METLLWGMLIVGIVLMLISVFFDGLFDFDGGIFFSTTVWSAFCLSFSGTGLLLIQSGVTSTAAILYVACTVGVVVFLVVALLVRFFYRTLSTSNVHSQQEMVGKTATIITPCSKDATGELVYEQGGARLTSPCRSLYDEAFSQGATVRITEVRANVYYIEEE